MVMLVKRSSISRQVVPISRLIDDWLRHRAVSEIMDPAKPDRSTPAER
jgi:hypothetical protein